MFSSTCWGHVRLVGVSIPVQERRRWKHQRRGVGLARMHFSPGLFRNIAVSAE